MCFYLDLRIVLRSSTQHLHGWMFWTNLFTEHNGSCSLGPTVRCFLCVCFAGGSRASTGRAWGITRCCLHWGERWAYDLCFLPGLIGWMLPNPGLGSLPCWNTQIYLSGWCFDFVLRNSEVIFLHHISAHFCNAPVPQVAKQAHSMMLPPHFSQYTGFLRLNLSPSHLASPQTHDQTDERNHCPWQVYENFCPINIKAYLSSGGGHNTVDDWQEIQLCERGSCEWSHADKMQWSDHGFPVFCSWRGQWITVTLTCFLPTQRSLLTSYLAGIKTSEDSDHIELKHHQWIWLMKLLWVRKLTPEAYLWLFSLNNLL